MSDLTVEEYSDKCIVVRGDTKMYKEQFKQMGGKWNPNLRDGAGWIFSKKHEEAVSTFISSGKVKPIEKEENQDDLLRAIEALVTGMSSRKRLLFLAKVTELVARSGSE